MGDPLADVAQWITNAVYAFGYVGVFVLTFFGEPAPARPDAADPTPLRLPGLGGALLFYPGDGGLDDSCSGRLLCLLLFGGVRERGEFAPACGPVRTVRARARVRPGQGGQGVRAPRWEGDPDRPPRPGHRGLYLDPGRYQAHADPLAVPVLHHPRQHP